MSAQTGYVMTLANSIIGVSLLAMPFCLKQCGVALGIVLLLASNILTRLACHFLVKSATMCRRKSFEYVAYDAFGNGGKLLIELGIIGFMMGTSVAYFVVMGDLAPAIISKMFELGATENLRSLVLLVVGVFIILPLSLLKNIESLVYISSVSMVFYMLLVAKVLSESLPHLAAADWPNAVSYWRPEGILQCFPIFAMALSCQTQLFEILDVLPNPSVERMNSIVKTALGLCTGLYIAVGFLGYVAYVREPFGGNVLLSFDPSFNSDVFQLGFVGSIALSFPIVVFPCRASLNSLIYKKMSQHHEPTSQSSYISDGRFKCLTICIVGSALVTSLLIPSVEIVLGFVGSTIGVATCVIFPAAAFINISPKDTTERLAAKFVLGLGFIVMILGTYANIDALSDRSIPIPTDNTLVKIPLQQIPPSIDGSKKGLSLDLPRDEVLQKVEEAAKRIEPPNPEAPVDKIFEKKDKLPDVPAETKVEKESAKDPLVPKDSIQDEKSKLPAIPNESPPIPVVESVPVKEEAVHQDAIAKEEKELKENDSPQKIEEEKKKQELLETLAEHQKEQKKLLEEQQNILDEIKIRGGEAKEPGPIKAAKFNDNIEKIQEVIDELKEKKIIMDRNKGVKIAEEKKRVAEKKSNSEKMLKDALIGSVEELPKPEPLLLKTNKTDTEPVKDNNVISPGRDILQEKIREKRDTDKEEDESCKKTENPANAEKDKMEAKQTDKVSPPEFHDIPPLEPKQESNSFVRLLENKEEGRRKRK